MDEMGGEGNRGNEGRRLGFTEMDCECEGFGRRVFGGMAEVGLEVEFKIICRWLIFCIFCKAREVDWNCERVLIWRMADSVFWVFPCLHSTFTILLA